VKHSSCVIVYDRSRLVLFYDCEPGPAPTLHSGNKRQFCSSAFTSTTRNIPPHPYHRSASVLGSNSIYSGDVKLASEKCWLHTIFQVCALYGTPRLSAHSCMTHSDCLPTAVWHTQTAHSCMAQPDCLHTPVWHTQTICTQLYGTPRLHTAV
jgi:hypothetical protein